MRDVIMSYDTEKRELSIIVFGSSTLILPDFEKSPVGLHRLVLAPYAQEKLIKNLVANMELKEVTPTP